MFAVCFMAMLSLVLQVESQPALGVPRDAMESLEAIGRLIDQGKLAAARQQLQDEVTRHGESYQNLLSASANSFC